MPAFSKEESKIKMCVLRSGKNEPIVWYSFITKDGNDSETICKKMLARFQNYLKKHPAIEPTINVINFYEKGNLIATTKR